MFASVRPSIHGTVAGPVLSPVPSRVPVARPVLVLAALVVLAPLVGLGLPPAEAGAQPSLPAHAWSRGHGDFRPDSGQDVAVASDGSVVVVGHFERTVDFGGGAVSAVGTIFEDAFVVKYAADSTHLWTRTFGLADEDDADGVAIDGDGNVLVVGSFWQETDLGDGTITGNGRHDIVLICYDGDGGVVWSRTWGGIDSDRAWAVTVDGAGNWYVGGAMAGTIDFGNGAVSSNGGEDGLILKLSPTGTVLWSYTFGSVLGDERVFDLGLDGAGNLYATGTYSEATDFGGGVIANAGNADLYLMSLTGDGAFRWANGYGASFPDVAHTLAVDSQANVTFGGSFQVGVDFGGGSLNSSGGADMFLAQVDSTGAHRWSQRFGDSVSFQELLSVDVGPGDVLTTTGFFSGTVDFGGGPLVGNSTFSPTDVFLASFEADGTHRWSRMFGGSSVDRGQAVVHEPDGRIFLTGSYTRGVDFGGGALPDTGSQDMFLARYDGATDTAAPEALRPVTLRTPYPNPFNPRVNVRFALDRPSTVELVVRDLAGRRVATLERTSLDAGSHVRTWDGRDASGEDVASGTYLFELRTHDGVEVRKGVLVR